MIKTLALAAFLTAQSGQAPAPPKPCIPKEQIGDAAMVMAPHVIEGLARHCATHLPAAAFLNSGAPAFVTRMKSESTDRQASAMAVLLALAGDKIPGAQDQKALVQTMGELVAAMAVSQVDAKMCGSINSMVEALSPLPTRNVGLFASSLAALMAAQSEGKDARICTG
jgi:hypothetical protein